MNHKTFSEQLCGWICLNEGSEENDQTVSSWQGDSSSNNLMLQQQYAEEHLNAQHVKPWSGWATAANHSGLYSCQLRTGIWGYNGHRFTKTGQLKIVKTFPVWHITTPAMTCRWIKIWQNGRFAAWIHNWQICSNCVIVLCQYKPKSLRNISSTLLNPYYEEFSLF